MKHPISCSLALPILLAACGSPQEEETPPPGDIPSEAPVTPSPAPAATAPEDGVNDGYPDLTPPVLTDDAERSETGARNVLTSWARAIELEEFDQAWALMSDADHVKWSKVEFTAIFEELEDITVAVPTGSMEGAAGSSYYTAPVEITAMEADGRPVRYEGEVVLRRVNDVPGATPEQLHWHIENTQLDWTH